MKVRGYGSVYNKYKKRVDWNFPKTSDGSKGIIEIDDSDSEAIEILTSIPGVEIVEDKKKFEKKEVKKETSKKVVKKKDE